MSVIEFFNSVILFAIMSIIIVIFKEVVVVLIKNYFNKTYKKVKRK